MDAGEVAASTFLVARGEGEEPAVCIPHTTFLMADLFVLDEVGFRPFERDGATFLLKAINKRYAANKSTIKTSNLRQWHEIFPDLVLAVALLDRLLHHSTTLNIRGDSFRQRHRKQTGLPRPIDVEVEFKMYRRSEP